ncbi:ASCH domain-containing protein [Streptomyces tanashiensis]|uniref:ASCH domain-containing protein n=1 Tax=Streptomyces tanashiensis TaxID=67367 RepID=UPI0036E6CE52
MLLSVHPRFATAILAGTKTVEVRRQRVAAPPGTPVLLYATAPTMAIVGMARIASVQVASPREVWSASRASAGISRREYDEYMSGATQASVCRSRNRSRSRLRFRWPRCEPLDRSILSRAIGI